MGLNFSSDGQRVAICVAENSLRILESKDTRHRLGKSDRGKNSSMKSDTAAETSAPPGI